MGRVPRADEAGGLYHALNRGNSRSEIFHKEADYEAFERILAEGLENYDVQLYCYQLMPNHWHLVLRPNKDGEMSKFMRWITATHTMRYRAHYHTLGEGHVYQGRFKSAEEWRWGSLWRWLQPTEPSPVLLSPWPIPRLPYWVDKVNEPLTDRELQAVRKSAQRGSPFGDSSWLESTVDRLGLRSTLRPRGRPQVRFPEESRDKES